MAGANPQGILSALGATPAPDGFHVNAPSGPMRMAGLQPGDVLQRINGMAMADLAANPGALQAAMANGTARIELMRAGQPLTLSIPLR
jgi:general secretion pathway protein C